MNRIAFYTSGFIGGGHLVLAEAIGRGLERAGAQVDYRVFYAEQPVELPRGARSVVHRLDTSPTELRSPESAAASETARALREFRPDLLLVDLAFRDLRFVLPLPNCAVWLLLRWIPEKLIRGPFNRTFDETLYERVIATEPGLPFAVPHQLEPIVICNRDELLPPSALRQHFAVPDDKPLSLIAHTGKPSEVDALEEGERLAFPSHAVVRASLHDQHALFPLAPYLAGADRIVGGAGYGLYWELSWLGLLERAELRPFPRGIDDQTPRMRAGRGYAMRENGADQLARWIREG